MTRFLIRTFIKNYEETKNRTVRSAYGKMAGWVGIVCNILLFAGKFLIGLLSGSVSISADAINNLSDASSNIISLLGFKMGSKPADQDHPYGHARYEYLSGLLVALIILVIGVELLQTSIQKIRNPEPAEFNWIFVGILVGSILVKLWMAVFNRSIGRAIESDALLATAADSRNDVISTGAVLIAALLSHYTSLDLDGWMGVAVALFILYSGVGLVKDTLDPLLGKAPSPALVEMIQNRVMSYDGVLGTHDLMVHDYGPGRLFASVHVEMAAEEDVLKCHDIIDTIEKDFLEKENLNMVIHFDPIVTSDAVVGDMRRWLSERVKQIDERITIHDLRMVPGESHTNMIFDCVVPQEFSLTDSEVKHRIRELVTAEYPGFHCVITIDKSYAAIPHSKEQELEDRE
ncbi:MAG: cation diffusion facilitator family transporter [Bacteroides sp.]|nr:cation diffusion facilitator family transporter [Bacteroides sp.]MCM1549568.1 cation diffusion facilitator family transporter [Clostridium sp.]